MRAINSHLPYVCCSAPTPLSVAPSAQMTFSLRFERLYVWVEPSPQREYSHSTGIEGMGDQFFADERGRLVEFEVDVPGAIVAPPALEGIRASVHARARLAEVELLESPLAPARASACQLFRPFGAAFFWFDHDLWVNALTPDWTDPPPYERVASECEFVQIARGVFLGLDACHHGLRMGLFEGFEARLFLDGELHTEASSGGAFMHALGEIQLASYAHLPPEEFARVTGALIATAEAARPPPPPDALDALKRFVGSLLHDLGAPP